VLPEAGKHGRQAAQRSAYADAIRNYTEAIDLLQRLTESSERIQRELLLQLAVGPALVAIKGYAAPDVERAYTRARELCERLDEPHGLFFHVLYGLWLTQLVRGELRKAYALAEELLRRAQSGYDPANFLYAHLALGETSYSMGELLRAREHLELAISFYEPERSLVFRSGGGDVAVVCLCYSAWTLWQLGYPDQALKRRNAALALAQGLSHPFSLAAAEFCVGVLRQFRREAPATQENAAGVIALSAEHGFTQWLAYATTLRGWAVAEQGRNENGIRRSSRVSHDRGGAVPAVFSKPAGGGVHGDGPPRRRPRYFDGRTGRRR
jgi:tetratricopeptide (TPR) repeat protein